MSMAQKLTFGHQDIKLLGQLKNCHVGLLAVAISVVSCLMLWLTIHASKCASYNSSMNMFSCKC
jgi:hypothetical protein